jgi:hypothetical protein
MRCYAPNYTSTPRNRHKKKSKAGGCSEYSLVNGVTVEEPELSEALAMLEQGLNGVLVYFPNP